MLGERGDFYFHFTTAEAAFEFILPDRRLRLSPHGALRDPFEYKEWEFGEFAGAYFVSNLSNEKAIEVLAAATASLNELRKRTKVLALSTDPPASGDVRDESPFGRGWGSARMWEHYAENHAGACLLFDRQKLDEVITQELGSREPGAGMTQACFSGPVSYPARASAGRGLALSDEIASPEEAARHFESHVEEMLFSKTDDWASECEYRYVVMSPGYDYEFVDYKDALHAVIVGERFPAWQASGALEVCAEVGSEAKQMSFTRLGAVPVPLVPWVEREPHLRQKARELRHSGSALPASNPAPPSAREE